MIEGSPKPAEDNSRPKVSWRGRFNDYLSGVAHILDFPGMLFPRKPSEDLSSWEALSSDGQLRDKISSRLLIA